MDRHTSDYFIVSKEKSSNDAKKLRCPAGIGLSLFAVMGVILRRFRSRAPLAVNAYIALCNLIDCFQALPRGSVEPTDLLDNAEAFLAAFVRAFGLDHMTPKYHWLLHFWKTYESFGMLIACFVHERKHKMLKRYCNDIQNTTIFEHSVLSEVHNKSC